jgi:hypothetical protein
MYIWQDYDLLPITDVISRLGPIRILENFGNTAWK